MMMGNNNNGEINKLDNQLSGHMMTMKKLNEGATINNYQPKSDGTLLANIAKTQNNTPTIIPNNYPNHTNNTPNQGYPYPNTNIRNPYGTSDLKSELSNDSRNSVNSRTSNFSRDSIVAGYGANKHDIKELANDINSSLSAIENMNNMSDTESDNPELEDIESRKKKRKRKTKKRDTVFADIVEPIDSIDYGKIFMEFLILLTWYVIMSQGFVVNIISGYIHQMNCDDNGVVPLSGIIIYGIIITSLFIITRYFVFRKLK